MKNKTLALLGVAIVLFSVLLVAIPAIAADQTTQKAASAIKTASEDDYTLGIYGNANEDDTIDMRDLTYVKLIFFGKKPETELADAKYDGKINPLDFIQIKLIIVGKEKELTIVDSGDRIVTVEMPVESIVALTASAAEAIKLVKEEDKVVGVYKLVKDDEILFPELSKLPSVGDWYTNPDYEKIIELEPDIVITYPKYIPEAEDKLGPAGITVIRLYFYKYELMTEEMEKLGYLLDRKDEANEFIDFREGCLNSIKEKTDELSEGDKPRVYFEYCRDYQAVASESGLNTLLLMVGGRNIAGDLPGSCPDVDKEWVIEQNPDIIIKMASETKVASGYDVDDPSEMKALREAIFNRPEMAGTTAIRNEDVYLVTSKLGYTKRFVICPYMAKWLHPDSFEDLDPQAIHQEYLDRFMRIDYDLDEHGVFVYPEPS